MNNGEDPLVRSGWHNTFGWLRRPELDVANGGYCYEHPDGEIVVSNMRVHRQAMYLNCYHDRDRNELYVTPSVAPRLYRGKKAYARK